MRVLIPSLFALALAIGPAFAADGDLAVWAAGPGDIAGTAASEGAGIPAGTVIRSGDAPARVTLAKAAKSQLILAPDSAVVLVEKAGGIEIQLQQGIVQADIADKGSYQDLHVVGAALDVRVTGTLFMVQRVKADTDYVSLIEGKIKVSLRSEVAAILGRAAESVELTSRQGLGGSTGAGFGGVETLASRPQVPVSSVAMRSASIRAVDPAAGGGNWNQDQGLNATTTDAVAGGTTPPITTEQVQAGVADQVRAQVAAEVSTQVTQSVSQSVQEQVVNQVIGTVPDLGRPPGPPR